MASTVDICPLDRGLQHPSFNVLHTVHTKHLIRRNTQHLAPEGSTTCTCLTDCNVCNGLIATELPMTVQVLQWGCTSLLRSAILQDADSASWKHMQDLNACIVPGLCAQTKLPAVVTQHEET